VGGWRFGCEGTQFRWWGKVRCLPKAKWCIAKQTFFVKITDLCGKILKSTGAVAARSIVEPESVQHFGLVHK
jgi:hypothetical protein